MRNSPEYAESTAQGGSLRNKYDLDFSDIHGKILPADIRDHDRILARVRLRGSDSPMEALKVWRLSPLGIELAADANSSAFRKGDAIDLELVITGQRSLFEGLVVDQIEANADITLLGVRLSRKLSSRVPTSDRRAGDRWICSDEFLPTCVAPTPGRFDDFVYFQIRDISAEGLQLSCSLRNKFLIPGMRLALSVVFPMAQMVSIDVEIVRVGITSYSGRDMLMVGTRFHSIGLQAKTALGQYIVQFGNVDTLEALKHAGLAPRSVSLGVDFYNLKSEEDYRSILELRYLAHTADGNLCEGASIQDLADINDARARIIVGKYRGRVVATARVRYNDLREPLEHEAFVEWPANMPRRDQIVEVSRVATHPDFRKNDLLAALFRYTYLNIADKDRPWAVISCLDHMVPFYEKLGFRHTGLRHTEPLWKEDRVLNVMIVNLFDLIAGRGVSPFYWNFMWRDVAQYLRDQGVVKPNGLDRIRMSAFKILAPFSEAVLWWLRFVRVKRSRLGKR